VTTTRSTTTASPSLASRLETVRSRSLHAPPAPRVLGHGGHATPTVRGGAVERLRRWSARHPVAAFLVIGFAVAYPVMSLPVMASHGVIPDGWMPRTAGVDPERVASVLGILVGLLPAALWVTWATEGSEGVRSLGRRMRRWRFATRWWVMVLAGLPGLTLTFAVLLGDTFTPVDAGPFLAGQLVGLLVNLLLINLWEETAWAGVVQPRLQHRHGLAKAALLTAVPFALFHMPLHFIGNFTIGSLATALITLLIVCAVVRLMIGVFLRGTGGSLIAVALLHTLFNRSNNEEGLVAALVEGDGRKLAGLIAVLILTVAAVLVARRSRSLEDRT
jgi:membrane protease YdiL (CAAX protease family)